MVRETPKAARAFQEYCLLGNDRSLAKLAQKLGKPSGYARTLEAWSSQHHWQDRVRQWDEDQFKAQEASLAAEKQKVLSEGYALMHERVKTLNVLAKKLVADIAKGRLYRSDVRSIGTGKDARQVDVEMFEEGVLRELRGCLDDIAKELGERVKKTETAITQLPGNVYIGFNPSDELGVDP